MLEVNKKQFDDLSFNINCVWFLFFFLITQKILFPFQIK